MKLRTKILFIINFYEMRVKKIVPFLYYKFTLKYIALSQTLFALSVQN